MNLIISGLRQDNNIHDDENERVKVEEWYCNPSEYLYLAGYCEIIFGIAEHRVFILHLLNAKGTIDDEQQTECK